MPDLQSLLDATAAREKLWAIPGVRQIGFGLKERGGEVVPEYVFRVYVDAKKPMDRLAPGDAVPPEVDGIPTDVVVLHEKRLDCGARLRPGIQITREVLNAPEGWGTIGCLVRSSGQVYILTNQHVLVPSTTVAYSTDVYQPEKSTVAQVPCNSPIARVAGEAPPFAFREVRLIGGKQFWVDCALATVNAGVTWQNEIDGVGAVRPDIRDVAAEATQPVSGPDAPAGALAPVTALAVQKRGAKSNISRGTVVELCREQRIDGVTVVVWEMQVRVTAGPSYDETYDIAPDEDRTLDEIIGLYGGEAITATRAEPGNPASRRLRFQGLRFSESGDSGAAWLDDSRRMVGLHYSGSGHRLKVAGQSAPVFVPNGRGAACHIAAVFQVLGLDPATSVPAGSTPTAGAALAAPGGAFPLAPDEAALARLAALESDLERIPRGRRVMEAVRRHVSEVRVLVHHRRRVTVAWHRHKGPAFVAAVMNGAREGSTALPREVAGHRLADLVRGMRGALAVEGSPELRDALRDDGELLAELAERCASYDEALAILAGEEAGAPA